MAGAALPVNLTPSPSPTTPVPGDQPVDVAPSGAAKGIDQFAALLATQVGLGVKKGPALVASVVSEKGAGTEPAKALPDPAATLTDPSLQAQQAALFMPVPVQVPLPMTNGINEMTSAQSKADAAPVASATGAKFDAAGAGSRQPVAGDPAAFAGMVASEAHGGGVQPAQGAGSAQAVRLDAAKLSAVQEGAAYPLSPQALAQSAQANGQSSSVSEGASGQVFDKLMAAKLSQEESAQPAIQPAPAPSVSGLLNPIGVQTASAPQAVSSIPQAVNHSAWGDMLGNRVVWMVSQQHQGVELHLNPPSLGPLEVRLSMNDGQANLSFATQHLPVKEAIESAAPRLREMLGESGISLGSVSVNVGSFTQQQQPSDQQAQTSAGRSSWQPSVAVTELPAVRTTTRLSGGNGMVDIFA